MDSNAAITNALSLPNGARFYRCAFQVNPAHYSGTYRGDDHGLDDREYIDELLRNATEYGVQVFAVTDHNHVGAIDEIRNKASDHNIIVLPGFEVASSEGVHVLCIYSPDTSTESLSRYLGELGIRHTDTGTDLSTKPFCDLLECVYTQGGITIAAHITQASGLLTQLHGRARVNAWTNKYLLAVQIPGDVDSVPPDKLPIVRNRNAEYKREPGASEELAIAVVNAGDVAKPDDLADPGTTCLIKMCEVTVNGLRQAFLDPASRIRLNSDSVPEEHTEFVAISWLSGFFGDAAIHFNENLNVLIGGRGTGKSTIIESIRYVLGLEALGPDARKVSESIVKNVLGSGTKISLLVRSYSPSRREYLIERTVPNPPVVRDEAGNVLDLKPTDVVPGAEVYGQHEISEIARSAEKRTLLLERFIERDGESDRKKAEVVRELEKSRLKFIELRKELSQIEERLGTLPHLEETSKRFEEVGLADRLKDKSLLVREEQVLETITSRTLPILDLVDKIRQEMPLDRAFLSEDALGELPSREILAKGNDVLQSFERGVAEMLSTFDELKESVEQESDEIRSLWNERKEGVEEEYSKILRELQKQKIDGEQFISVRRQIEQLRPLREQHAVLREELRQIHEKRKNDLVRWEDLKTDEFSRLERAAKRVSRQLSNRVRVRVTSSGNREPLIELLRTKIRGRFAESLDALRAHESLSLRELAQACRDGKQALSERFGLAPAQAERLVEVGEAVWMSIEELDLGATTAIELNIAAENDSPEWKALDELSTGQRATAILLLLLLKADAPLVVDQPEDDLDNRFITEGIVPKMREEKRRRQFIFSTHNANIPVLGDAELIVGLTAGGDATRGQARISREGMGSIDDPRVKSLVEEVLEGGRTAFELRRLKYGF